MTIQRYQIQYAPVGKSGAAAPCITKMPEGPYVLYTDHAAELAAERTKVERLRGALIGACERMERARNILQTPNSNWAMLDTATLRAALEAER